MLRLALCVLGVLLAVPSPSAADHAKGGNAGGNASGSRRWFSDLGVDFRYASAFVESPTARNFDAFFTMGAAVDVAVLAVDLEHYFIIPISYMRPVPSIRGGTEKIDVVTVYQFADIGLKYLYVMPHFSMGLTAGASMLVATTRTRLFSLGREQASLGDIADPSDDMYVFPEKKLYDMDKRVGLETGVFVGLEVGFDVGKALGATERLFELKTAFQYDRRGVRNELYVWGALEIHPMAYLDDN